MEKQPWFQTRKAGSSRWLIQEWKGPVGYRTVGESDNRKKANTSAAIRSSARVLKTRGPKS